MLKRRLRVEGSRLLLAIACLAACFYPGIGSGLSVIPFFSPHSSSGVELETPDISAEEISALKAAGIRWVRMPLLWESTEVGQR